MTFSKGTISDANFVFDTDGPLQQLQAINFGIEAEFIRALDFGVTTVVLKPGPHNDVDLLGSNGDVLLQEV